MFSEFRRSILTVVALVAIAAPLGGCTSRGDAAKGPQQALTEYISKGFNVRSVGDRQDLMARLTGDARARLAAWSDDQFREAFVETRRQFLKLSLKESKSVSANEVSITYELSYLDQTKGHDARVTQKKLAELVREDGAWKVASVQNIKELVEYRNEMSL